MRSNSDAVPVISTITYLHIQLLFNIMSLLFITDGLTLISGHDDTTSFRRAETKRLPIDIDYIYQIRGFPRSPAMSKTLRASQPRIAAPKFSSRRGIAETGIGTTFLAIRKRSGPCVFFFDLLNTRVENSTTSRTRLRCGPRPLESSQAGSQRASLFGAAHNWAMSITAFWGTLIDVLRTNLL